MLSSCDFSGEIKRFLFCTKSRIEPKELLLSLCKSWYADGRPLIFGVLCAGWSGLMFSPPCSAAGLSILALIELSVDPCPVGIVGLGSQEVAPLGICYLVLTVCPLAPFPSGCNLKIRIRSFSRENSASYPYKSCAVYALAWPWWFPLSCERTRRFFRVVVCPCFVLFLGMYLYASYSSGSLCNPPESNL